MGLLKDIHPEDLEFLIGDDEFSIRLESFLRQNFDNFQNFTRPVMLKKKFYGVKPGGGVRTKISISNSAVLSVILKHCLRSGCWIEFRYQDLFEFAKESYPGELPYMKGSMIACCRYACTRLRSAGILIFTPNRQLKISELFLQKAIAHA